MVLFSSSILHAAASDRDYFKGSYNGLLIYLAKMRKLARIGHLLADDNFYFESGSHPPTEIPGSANIWTYPS